MTQTIQEEVERLNRVLAAHLADERSLSWVGTSRARFAAVVEAFGDGRASLRRAIELAQARKPEIPASNNAAEPVIAPARASLPLGEEWHPSDGGHAPCYQCGGDAAPCEDECRLLGESSPAPDPGRSAP
jgi:hypothetical protein